MAISSFIFKPWQTKPTETISVSAEGKTQITPNIAKISATISTNNDDLNLARSQNEEKVNSVLAALKVLSIAEEDIQTQYISGGPTYEIQEAPQVDIQIFPPPQRTKTNQISVTFEITIRDFTLADKVIAAFTQNGATNLNGPRLTVDEQTLESAKSEARKNAVKNAQNKAAELASLSDKNLGEVISINEGNNFRIPTPIYALAEEDIQEKINTIQPGQNDVSITIQVEFALK